MGCINSKTDFSDIRPNIYRVVNVDGSNTALWSGHLEITPRELILYRKGKEPTKWLLQHLRRYGFDADLFTFEAGRRCTTGEGIYAFKCRQAESLFHTLQTYIQGTALNEDGLQTLGEQHAGTISRNSQFGRQAQVSRPNSLIGGQTANSNTNYVIPNSSRNQSLSPNGTIHSSNQSRSIDTLTGEGNYLEPTPLNGALVTRYSSGMRLGSLSSGPLSPDPHSPGSPNSFSNIHEVTQLNSQPHHQQAYQNSNLYQEFPLRSNESNNNNLLNKKLSLDIPPSEPAPQAGEGATTICSQAIKTHSLVSASSFNADELSTSPKLAMAAAAFPPLSPTSDDGYSHMYMNVTPGEMDGIIGTPTIVTTTQINFGFARLSSSYSFDPATRCYENLDPVEIRPLLIRNRYSKPDIFSKVDLPPLTANKHEKSEPSTPTIKENRRVNYIVLDLDQSPSSSSLATALSASTPAALTLNCSGLNESSVGATNGSASSTQSTGAAVTSSISQNSCNNNTRSASKVGTPTGVTPGNSLLPPESPKKASMGYATIDFNKTVALSNSVQPSAEVDTEGSRKTRHSSTAARHSNSISD